MPLTSLLLALLICLFGLYEIGYGYDAYRVNGFHFYAIAGWLIGAPFLVAAAILFFLPGRNFGGWEFLLLAVWLFGVIWKAWKKRQARRVSPQAWASWEEVLKK